MKIRNKGPLVTPGTFFNPDGSVTGTPKDKVTHIVCRRAADFGGAMGGSIPPTAARDRCDTCNAEVVYNPDDPKAAAMIAAGATRRCQRCSGIEPLPFGAPS